MTGERFFEEIDPEDVARLNADHGELWSNCDLDIRICSGGNRVELEFTTPRETLILACLQVHSFSLLKDFDDAFSGLFVGEAQVEVFMEPARVTDLIRATGWTYAAARIPSCLYRVTTAGGADLRVICGSLSVWHSARAVNTAAAGG